MINTRSFGRPHQGGFRRRARAGAIVCAALLAAAGNLPAFAYPRPGRTERISVATGGAQATGGSTPSAVSADGRYVAFFSHAPDLVPGDTNGTSDVFVRDRVAGTTERVSVTTGGAQATEGSYATGISVDGRYVAFVSTAPDLVPGDTNEIWDVFVRDRIAGTTERVSVATGGAQAYGPPTGGSASISADGRYVAFRSDAYNLVPGDTNGTSDVFVRDRVAGTTERVSVTTGGAEANGTSYVSTSGISADGRHVAFMSYANNLVPGDTGQNNALDIFVRDRVAGTTERASVATGGAEPNGGSYTYSISADGNHVAFESDASNLVPGDTNEKLDMFVRNRVAGTTERVSVATGGAQAAAASYASVMISADGRYVAFRSLAPNLVPGDTNGALDIFVRDRVAGTTERVSVGAGGAESTRHSFTASISSDGRYVAFDTDANLDPDDTNATWDVFIRDRGPATGVGDLSVTKAAGEVQVSGWSRFAGMELVSAPDPPADAVPAAGAVGGELTGAALLLRPEEDDLLARLDLASLPGAVVREASRVLYGMAFAAGGTSYEIRALRADPTTVPSTAPYFGLYRCAPSCAEITRLTGGIGIIGTTVVVSVPLDALEGPSPVDAVTEMRAFTAVGEASSGPLVALDDVELSDAIIPVPRVELGIALAETAVEEVAFTREATVDAGAFSGALETSSLSPGKYRVWARACLGNTCGAHSAEVTL